jgi:hypothetical protein
MRLWSSLIVQVLTEIPNGQRRAIEAGEGLVREVGQGYTVAR